jgi:3-isopropylmalate/(R)-2-methylmalate dehydratase small subunit
MNAVEPIEGRSWVFGDNVDTNVMAPGSMHALIGLTPEQEAEHLKRACFSAIRPGFHERVSPGDVLVAGRNFGQGSHRERANLALIHMGLAAVIADSLARIFFRNCVAFGFVAVECPGVSSLVREGDRISLDLAAGRVINLATAGSLRFQPLTPLVRSILAAGGMLPMVRDRLAAEQV